MAPTRPKVDRKAPQATGPAPRRKHDWIADAIVALGFAVASGLLFISASH